MGEFPASRAPTAGERLTFSAGTNSNHRKYRTVRGGMGVLPLVAQLAPALVETYLPGEPLIVQAHPATLSIEPIGPLIDTYLDPSVFVRSMRLAAELRKKVILCSQPLCVARLLLEYLAVGETRRPGHLLMALGGYPLPNSLEAAIGNWCAEAGIVVDFVQFYGVAEIDAALMVSTERNLDREPIYHARTGVRPVVDADCSLSVELEGSRFATTDLASATPQGVLLRGGLRWTPEVIRQLDSWTPSDWRRRTGHLNGHTIQLREALAPVSGNEQEFFDFARVTGMQWLHKPNWANV
jgi:hypothetical protein